MSGGGGGFDIGPAVSGDAAGFVTLTRPSEPFRAVARSAIALRTGEMPPWARKRSGHTDEDHEKETEDTGSD